MERNSRKIRIGTVEKDAANKTVTVRVERMFKHPMYGKRVRRTTKYLAHDENNMCKAGSQVRIEETRPLSKRKHWRVTEVLTAAEE